MESIYLFLGIPASALLFIGIVLLIVSLMTIRPRHHWILTTATIIKKEKNYVITLHKIIHKEDFISKGPDSAPSFRYMVNGIEYKTTSKIQQRPGFHINTDVEILYNPDDPQQAVINTFIQRGMLLNPICKIFIILGFLLFMVTLVVYITS